MTTEQTEYTAAEAIGTTPARWGDCVGKVRAATSMDLTFREIDPVLEALQKRGVLVESHTLRWSVPVQPDAECSSCGHVFISSDGHKSLALCPVCK